MQTALGVSNHRHNYRKEHNVPVIPTKLIFDFTLKGTTEIRQIRVKRKRESERSSLRILRIKRSLAKNLPSIFTPSLKAFFCHITPKK